MLTEVVGKRMEAGPKLELVQALGIAPVVARWAAGPPVAPDEHELAAKYAR